MILRVNDRIRNRAVEYFDEFRLALKYDSLASTFSFIGQFDPANIEHKELYCLSHYHQVTLEHNNQRLLTGYMLSEVLKNSKIKSPVAVAGYSLPGFLEDCQIPKTLYPLQFNNLSLREIASKILAAFNLKMVVDSSVATEMDKPFKETEAQPSQTIKSFLTELATQKNIVITHNEYGNVLFTRPNTTKKPVLNYGGEGLPCPEMTISFNGQAMHSDITVMKQPDKTGSNAGEATIKNPFVRYVFRPRVVMQSSGDDIDTVAAARNVLSEELRNLSLSFSTDRWDLDGRILKPGDLITVLNPEIYLYKRSTWFIEQVSLLGNSKSLTAEIKCVLPEVYNNETPKYLFEGINLH